MNRQTIMNRLIIVPTVLLAVIVIALLQGGGLVQQAQAGSNKKMMILPADFHPANASTTWGTGSTDLQGTGFFIATVRLPNKAKITSVTLYALDNSATAEVCLTLIMTEPLVRTDGFGDVCTEGSNPSALALPLPLRSSPTATHTYQPVFSLFLVSGASFKGVLVTYVMT
jgi:hypothetical protein